MLVMVFAAGANDLQDKRVAILGDSMTWIGGDSCQNERGWTHHFVEMTHPGAVDIYARSGATWTNTLKTRPDTKAYSEILDDQNVVYNQALRLIEAATTDTTKKPDIILIYAGANDAWFTKRRPGMFDNTPVASTALSAAKLPEASRHASHRETSLVGSMEIVFGMLAERFPDARIVIMTPVEMTKVPVASITRVADIIDETARKAGYDVLRADRDVEIRRAIELKKLTNTSDGAHTTPPERNL